MAHSSRFPVARLLPLALCALAASAAHAGVLGVTLPPASHRVTDLGPAGAMDLSSPDKLEDALRAVAALGIQAVVVDPDQGVTLEFGLTFGCGVPFEAGESDRKRVATALSVAEKLGLRVYLGGFAATKQGAPVPPLEQSRATEAAVEKALALLGSSPALAGLIWEAPPPPRLQRGAGVTEVTEATAGWVDGVSGIATTCGAACAAKGTRFVIATDAVAPLAAALAELPPGTVVWRLATVGRGPTVAGQLAALEAAVYQDRGGVLIRWESPDVRAMARTAALALAAGAETAVLGDIPSIVGNTAAGPPTLIPELAALAAQMKPAAPAAPYGPDADVLLVLDPAADLSRRIRPGADSDSDQLTPTLAALNEAGRSVAIALAPPAQQPVEPEGPAAPGPAAEAADERKPTTPPGREAPKEPKLPAQVRAIWLCNAARSADPFLDAAFSAADAGWTLVTYPDVGSLDPAGGPRAKESRDRLASKLPFERTRPFGVPVTKLRVVRALEGTSTKRGRELEVVPATDQGIYLGSARTGAEVLAEWFETSSPAFVVAPRGSGRVLTANGSPGLTRPSLVPDVLTHLRVGASRPRPVKVEEPRHQPPGEPRMLGRLGLIPDPPYENPPPAEVIAPPEFAEWLTTGESQSTFDATVVGPWGAVAALGPRRPGGETWLRFGGADLLLAGWDWAFVGSQWMLSTGREARVRGDVVASRYLWQRKGWVRSIYHPGGGQAVCPAAGFYKLEPATPDHALVATGGARVVRAERLPGEDGLVVEVDRPGLLEIRLDPQASAGKSVEVTLASGDSPAGVRLGPSQWWITSEDVLLVDALARVPVRVTFAPAGEDANQVTCSLRPLTGAREVLIDGWSAVLLDRYANAEVELAFDRWARPASRNVLTLTAVKGDLYGPDGPEPDAPAHVRVAVNGRTVYDADAPLRTCRSDGATEEWAGLTIPVPPEALRRGANSVVVRNEGPNAVFIHAASLRFEEPPAGK